MREVVTERDPVYARPGAYRRQRGARTPAPHGCHCAHPNRLPTKSVGCMPRRAGRVLALTADGHVSISAELRTFPARRRAGGRAAHHRRLALPGRVARGARPRHAPRPVRGDGSRRRHDAHGRHARSRWSDDPGLGSSPAYPRRSGPRPAPKVLPHPIVVRRFRSDPGPIGTSDITPSRGPHEAKRGAMRGLLMGGGTRSSVASSDVCRPEAGHSRTARES
jgi:hypothetical protein